MATTIAIANQKGGVGKSTTTFHLARAAVKAGKRVLLIDLDPQGNLTSIAARDEVPEDSVTVADALSASHGAADISLGDVLVQGVWDTLTLAPTTGDSLAVVRDELIIAGAGRETRLRRELARIQDDYDLVLIDCAPALDQLTINALAAAEAVLIITQSKLFSVTGLAKLLNNIALVKDSYNPALRIAGAIINQHEAQTNNAQHWGGELADALAAREIRLLEPAVPKRTVIGDAAEAATGLDEYGTAGAAELAVIYEGFVTELLGQGR